MLDNNQNALVAISGGKEIILFPEMANRHGLITGATGTGKTSTLQNLAETFSSMGVPVFVTDVKGDLSGISRSGGNNIHFQENIDKNHLKERGFEYKGFPVCFWDIFGEKGHPLRTTISEIGAMLLSRLLDLNEIQSGVLSLAFKIADDQGLLLLDIKDLRKMLENLALERSKYTITYGNISPASIGAIQRSLLLLEEQAGDIFFGEPAFDIFDFIQTKSKSGIVNILAADKLIQFPKIYTSFLLYLLSELYEQLPEAGDLNKPKLVFFFDEAHLLFKDISKVLLEKLEQVVRLIRSKGVGIFFCTHYPSDIPETVLGQLSNRIQHALRAYTPRDQKAVLTAANTFRQNPDVDTVKVITELAVGEALISFLDNKGIPGIVERAFIVPPQGQAGPITIEERDQIIQESDVYGVYEKQIDRESAYEILTDRMEKAQFEKEENERLKVETKLRKENDKLERLQEREKERLAQQQKREWDNSTIGSLTKMAKTKVKREGINVIFKLGRGLLGSLMKKK